jgi:hypothetical protein
MRWAVFISILCSAPAVIAGATRFGAREGIVRVLDIHQGFTDAEQTNRAGSSKHETFLLAAGTALEYAGKRLPEATQDSSSPIVITINSFGERLAHKTGWEDLYKPGNEDLEDLCDIASELDEFGINLDQVPNSALDSDRLPLMRQADKLWREIGKSFLCPHDVKTADLVHSGPKISTADLALQFKSLAATLQKPSVADMLRKVKTLYGACDDNIDIWPKNVVTNKLQLLNYALNNLHVAASMSELNATTITVLDEVSSDFQQLLLLWASGGGCLGDDPRKFDCEKLLNRIEILRRKMRSLLGGGMNPARGVDGYPECLHMRSAMAFVDLRLAESVNIGPTVKLHNGLEMPRLSYGTAHRASPDVLFGNPVTDGYRHFDLAQGYGDVEENFGRFITVSGLPDCT